MHFPSVKLLIPQKLQTNINKNYFSRIFQITQIGNFSKLFFLTKLNFTTNGKAELKLQEQIFTFVYYVNESLCKRKR